MAEGQGPFDQYLNQPYQPSRTPLSGLGGNTEGILNFANEFLRGVSQGRMQKMAEQERTRSRNIDALTRMASFANSASGLPPQALQNWNAKVSQRLFSEIAGADNGAKGKDQQGGNPLFGFVKGLASNMIGMGDGGGKKAKPIDEAELGTYLGELTDTISQHRQATSDIGQKLSQAYIDLKNKNGGWVDQEALAGDPTFTSIYNDAAARGIDVSKQLSVLMGGTLNPQQAQQRRDDTAFANFIGGQQQGQPVQAAPTAPQSGPVVAEQPKLGGYADLVEPPSPALIASNGAIPRGAVPPVQQFAQASGQQQIPSMFGEPFVMPPEIQRGYDARGMKPTEEFLYAGPRKYHMVLNYPVGPGGSPLVLEKGTNRRANMDVARREGYQILNTLPASAIGQSPEQMANARKALETRISAAPILKKPEDQRAAMAIVESQFATGDFKGASDSLERFISERERAAEREADDKRQMNRHAEIVGVTRGLKTAQFTSALRDDAEKAIKATSWDKVSQFMDQTEVAYKDLMADPKKPVQGYHAHTITRGIAHITDPTTGIRDAEHTLWNNAQGWLKKWQVQLNPDGTLMTGQTLSREALDEAYKLTKKLGEAVAKQTVDALSPVLSQAQSEKIPLNAVIRGSFLGRMGLGSNAEPPKPKAAANPTWTPGGGGGVPTVGSTLPNGAKVLSVTRKD